MFDQEKIYRGSRILKLAPFVDSEEVLLVKGRASRVQAGEFNNEPGILDRKHSETAGRNSLS